MQGSFVFWLKQKAPFLFEEKMPVWFTVLVGFAAGLATYVASPIINREFERNAARSTQVAKTTEGLNGQIINLSKEVRRLNEALKNNPAAVTNIRSRCYDLITEMQWRLVDLRVVLSDDDDISAIKNLAVAIRGVQNSLDKTVDADAEPQLVLSMTKLAEATERVLDRLYNRASLKQ